MVGEGLVDQGEIHGPGHVREREAVRGSEAGISVGSLQKLVTETRGPTRGHAGEVFNRTQAERASVGSADENRKRVVEAKGVRDRETRRRIQSPRLRQRLGRLVRHGLVKDRRDRGARVLHVDVNVARSQRPVADKRTAQIELAHHWRAFGLNRLRQDFPQDDLFGEVLRSNDDLRLPVAALGRPSGDAGDEDDDPERDGADG